MGWPWRKPSCYSNRCLVTETKFAMRHKCFHLKKKDSEDFVQYAAHINKHGEKFDVRNCTSDNLKVLFFVSGLKSPQDLFILEKLLAKVDAQSVQLEAAPTDAARAVLNQLTLQDLVNEAQRLLCLKRDTGTVGDKDTIGDASLAGVLAIQHKGKKQWTKNKQSSSEKLSPTRKQPPRPCNYCGANHWERECNFECKQCNTCHEYGHKAEFCEFARKVDARKESRLPRRLRHSSDQQVHHVSIQRAPLHRKYVCLSINDAKIKLQLDSASDITVISAANWTRLGKPALTPCDICPGSASGDPVKLWGFFPCRMSLNHITKTGICYVAARLNLLGIDWITALDLWSVPFATVCNSITTDASLDMLTKEVKTHFPHLFSAGLGLCTKTKVSLTLKPGAKPVFRKQRSVPFAAIPFIENELHRLQHLGVITPVEYSDFAAPIVAVKKKNGAIRICGDYSTGLNDALEPNKFPLPTPEHIFVSLAGKNIFSKIDLSDAFLQLELYDEAKRLLTINTHLGLFRVNRMQPGVKPAPSTFQELMNKLLSGLEGASAFIDDVVLGAATAAEHKALLFEVLTRLQDYGFKLRLDKCQFGQTRIAFCGHIIDASGIRPDPVKVQRICDILPPTDVSQLRAFLGSVNYYSKFVKGMKNLRGPLDELLRKGVKFAWHSKHQQAFNNLKSALSSDLVLTHYDPTKKIVVAADASSYGMGAVLMHEFPDGTLRPILHASSSFDASERNYPQVQREALALVFAVKKFHCYIYGHRFDLQTDHKSLLAIFGSKTGIPAHTASRLQRYDVILLAYDFTIQYVNTDNFGYADVLSRLIATYSPAVEDTVIAAIRMVGDEQCYAIDSANMLPIHFKDIQAATRACSVLRTLTGYISRGWPPSRKAIVNSEVGQFYDQCGGLMIIQDCIFLGDRLVIPMVFRRRILEELHRGYPGIVRMKMLARSKVFWPKIDKNIEEAVKACENYARAGSSPIKCSPQPWPIPKGPWSHIHVDYAGPVNGFYYFVIVDAYSKWPEIFKTTTITAAKTVEFLLEVFSRYGLCDTIVNDNGPQFISQEFTTFCKTNGIEHFLTAPYHPQLNGQAEKFVDLLKTGLKKVDGNTDEKLRNFLTCYRFTPSYGLGMKTPSELMNSRAMKTRLDLLKPTVATSRSRSQQFNTAAGARLREFQCGTAVYYKFRKSNNTWNWIPTMALRRIGTVNYRVKLSAPDRIVKAHANQLKFRHQSNELFDAFGLYDVSENEVEPTIIPQAQQCDDSNQQGGDHNDLRESSVHEAVRSDSPEVGRNPTTSKSPDAAQLAPRRTTRINAGVLQPAMGSNLKRKGMW
ncbi:hypothetical protein DMN91_007388 [Ooceraea biroi]|uniref:RNA-directed DNA polymerase n=2 Tax=Ooceraea biroi TaxID=2015173 RepID=A0A3L8DK05_OOCBI|nr:uncharacterized protein K02A2.6 [Ooceraea biroi]RLU20774.1 hypothetical protein DMN91_007388 [Ooceraea biroi]